MRLQTILILALTVQTSVEWGPVRNPRCQPEDDHRIYSTADAESLHVKFADEAAQGMDVPGGADEAVFPRSSPTWCGELVWRTMTLEESLSPARFLALARIRYRVLGNKLSMWYESPGSEKRGREELEGIFACGWKTKVYYCPMDSSRILLLMVDFILLICLSWDWFIFCGYFAKYHNNIICNDIYFDSAVRFWSNSVTLLVCATTATGPNKTKQNNLYFEEKIIVLTNFFLL